MGYNVIIVLHTILFIEGNWKKKYRKGKIYLGESMHKTITTAVTVLWDTVWLQKQLYL